MEIYGMVTQGVPPAMIGIPAGKCRFGLASGCGIRVLRMRRAGVLCCLADGSANGWFFLERGCHAPYTHFCEFALFQGLALELWREAIPEAQTRAEVDFLTGVFAGMPAGIPAGMAEGTAEGVSATALLDVPCGNGRLALRLAGRGFRMTGVDQAAPFITEAEAATEDLVRAGGHEITWHRGDMRELPWPEAFQGAYCMGNSFGYFDAAGTAAFFRAVAGALRPGGRFVLETDMAAESLLPVLEERVRRRVGEIDLLLENRYDAGAGVLETAYTFTRGGRQETRRARHWIFTVSEIQRMLALQGLESISLFESTEMEPYQLGSSRLILVAEKR